jgi:hypothetical protein
MASGAGSQEDQMREEFERLFPAPEEVVYNKQRDAYCWKNYPNTPHAEYNPMWEAWQAGFRRGQTDR